MSLKSRLEKLEKAYLPTIPQDGRIICDYEFPDDAAWQEAKAEHVRRWPNHKGIRFIQYDTHGWRQAYQEALQVINEYQE